MSQDALCAHLFMGLSRSFHPSLVSPPPPFPLVICFSAVGFWIHSSGAHCRALIHSRGWAPRSRKDDCGCSRLSLSPTPLAAPLLALCHAMMSWLSFAPGAPIDSLALLHYSTSPSSILPLTSSCVFLRQFLPQILLPLKRRLGDLGDVWMFSTPTERV